MKLEKNMKYKINITISKIKKMYFMSTTKFHGKKIFPQQ